MHAGLTLLTWGDEMQEMNSNTYVTFSECGQPENVLDTVTGEIRTPGEGEVLVRMLAAPINPADINFVQGVYGIKPELPNSIAGLEGCGIIEDSNSPDLSPGDQVIMLKGMGSWCQYLTAPAENFMKLPVKIEPAQAAMLKVNPITAWLMLKNFVDLKQGDWIVQNASNSGVGRCIIQIAKILGIRTINFVRRPDALRDELTALGADLVVGEDDDDVVKKTLESLGGARPVLASNAVGGESALRLMDMLAPGGSMVTYGAMSKKSIKVPNGFLIFKGIKLEGLWVTRWAKTAERSVIEEAYVQLAQWMSEGKLCQAVDSTYPLAEIRTAAARAQEEFRNGKIILDLSL